MYFDDAKAGEQATGLGVSVGEGAATSSSSNTTAAVIDPRIAAETAHWQVTQVCLDAYAQRMSASQADVAYIYDVMLNLGGLLLKALNEKVKEKGATPDGGVNLALGW